jgi:flagellar M-ring protein FliF
MASMKDGVSGAWRAMDRGVQIALVGAAFLAVAALAWGSFVLLHDDYGTLFAQLSDTDAAAVVDALKHQKVPYRLSDGGSTISVPADRVHDTRLGLMSSNLPLTGGVGFEIFDKQGLGVTEQSQRVSYQRALQGELARTIASLENVKQVRVHLVLPESSLFKRDRQDATAAVTVTMKPGYTLEHQQIVGVQRLVAASVAGLDPGHVVITDQRGVTLSAGDSESGNVAGVEARLDLQRQIETHISQKVAQLLDKAYGAGQALVSVSVALSFDAVKTTTQDLLPVKGSTDGGIVRKRQVTSNPGGGYAAETEANASVAETRRSNATTEIEYEYGRRVEEVIRSPGAVKRLTVGVVVPSGLADEQLQRIRELVLVAAGLDEARGDVVNVSRLDPSAVGVTAVGIAKPVSNDAAAESDAAGVDAGPMTAAVGKGGARLDWLHSRGLWYLAAAFAALLLIAALLGIAARLWRRRSLSDRQREELLQEIRRTLSESAAVTPLHNKS